ncbi:MAG: aminoacetone oxidase family FAD-binding enzyme [Deltaproteobacteria bacterium]|nr:MAG: aminoacetone oxidase family FAD-binding enzyme [Deltaproteobacteria bacterium]
MTDKTKPRIIVVGGGAAGLMAAGAAAEAGARVLILEKMKQPGRKLAITGKGRCNLTNSADIADCITHFGKNGRFLRQALHRFTNNNLIDFFNTNGLKTVTERGGRVFPAHGKAPEVVKVLRQWLNKSGATIRLSSPVEEFKMKDDQIVGVVAEGEFFPATSVILATGGASYPLTGSTGDGYHLAESVGHHIITPRPALVPLVCADSNLKKLAGLSLRNLGVRLFINNKKVKEIFRELLFTKDGISGPTVLTLSGMTVDALQNRDEVYISLDLKPALDEKKLESRLLRDFQKRGKESLSSLLRGLLPQEMVATCLDQTTISPDCQGHQVTVDERKRLRHWLKNFRLHISGHRPIAEAIITAGGIDSKEINPKTMASRHIKNLFFAGEIVDIQADTGGYNLQAAFSTGHLAGKSAAETQPFKA